MKQMLAIVLAIFILFAAAIPALAINAAGENRESVADQDAEKTAENEEKSALDANKRKPSSTDGTDAHEAKRTSKTARIIDSADNKFILAKNARQTSRTKGDYAALGGDAEVSRGVGGDVFAAGRNVLVTDDEELQNIAAAGVNVNVHVKNARNIYVTGGDVDVQADDGAMGVYIAGLSVTLAGTMTDAYIVGASANISGTIAENLTVRAGNVTFDPDATVGGEITIISKNRPSLPASIDPSKITYKTPGIIGRFKDGAWSGQTTLEKIGLVLTVSGIVAAVLISLILNAMRGGFFHERALRFKKFFWRDMLRGLAGIIVLPVLSMLLFVTVVGIPIGAVLLMIYGITLYLSPIVSGVILGRLIFPKLSRFASGAIVTCLLRLLMIVPYLGIAVSVATCLYGVGAIITAIPPRKDRGLRIRRAGGSPDSDGDAQIKPNTAENPA